MILPVTAVFASVCVVLLIVLSYRVAMFRMKNQKGLGLNGDRDFEVAVRTQANLVEYAPITLILLAIGELNGVSVSLIYSLGMAFVLGRIMHAWGMTSGRGGAHKGRFFGIILTWLSMLVLAVAVLFNVFQVNS